MRKLLTWLVRLLYSEPQSGIPASGDRRGKPVLLNIYPSKRMAVMALQDVVEAETQAAQEKIAKANHWGNVGYLEMQAIQHAQQVIKSHQAIKAPRDFVAACHASFEGLIKQWQSNTDDADGYGLATVKTIKRALERQQ